MAGRVASALACTAAHGDARLTLRTKSSPRARRSPAFAFAGIVRQAWHFSRTNRAFAQAPRAPPRTFRSRSRRKPEIIAEPLAPVLSETVVHVAGMHSLTG